MAVYLSMALLVLVLLLLVRSPGLIPRMWSMAFLILLIRGTRPQRLEHALSTSLVCLALPRFTEVPHGAV